MHLALNYTDDILFTPNFCNISEYKEAFDMGLTVNVFALDFFGLNLPLYLGHHLNILFLA
jgi:hypothetical protein